MKKKTPPTAATGNDELPAARDDNPEVIKAGEISLQLTRKLSEASRHLADDEMAFLITTVEAKRTDFTVHAIILGVALEAKKLALPHGKFQKSLAKWQRISNLEVGDRSLRLYRLAARHFLSHLERGDFREDLATKDLRQLPLLKDGKASILANPSFREELRAFVADRPLTRLLKDLNAAKKAAEAEELAEREKEGDTETVPPPKPPDTLSFEFKQEAKETLAMAFARIIPPEVEDNRRQPLLDERAPLLTVADLKEIHAEAESQIAALSTYINARSGLGQPANRAAFARNSGDLLS